MILMIDDFKYTMGIELELFGRTRPEIEKALNDAGIKSEIQLYNHVTSGVWKIIWDSSVDGEGTEEFINLHGEKTICGIEIVSPVLYGKNGIEELRIVCKVLNELGCKTNDTCGLHIHIGLQDLDYNNIKNILVFYHNNQNVIDLLISEDRRGNNSRFCQSLSIEQLEKIRKAKSMEQIGFYCKTRHRPVNARSYRRNPTIEFRSHEGTLDFIDIINWVWFIQKLIDYCKSLGDNILVIHREEDVMKQFNKLNKDLGLYKDKRLFKYFISHIEKGRDE